MRACGWPSPQQQASGRLGLSWKHSGIEFTEAETARGPADHEDERVPLQVRQSWWFRSSIGVFVLAFLAMISGAVRFAVMHQWVAFGVLQTVSWCFGVIAARMAAGYGWDEDKPDGGGAEELAPIPEEVRKNRWWRAALCGWLAWAILSSAEAVVTGVHHLWLAFAGGAALGGHLLDPAGRRVGRIRAT